MVSDSPCSAKSVLHLCPVLGAGSSSVLSGLSCCATDLLFVLSTCCGSAASQPIPGVSPVSGDDLALCLAAAVFAPCSLVGTELCFQAAVTALSPQPEELERNKIIGFHLALELCFWAVSGAETTPHLAEQPGQRGGELVFLLPVGLCPLGVLVPC